MSKRIIDNYNPRFKTPIDNRELCNNFSEIDTPYEGLITLQINDGKRYEYRNNQWIPYLNGIENSITEINSKLNNRGVINVKDFGAKGDGTTNDTLSINNAISSATLNGNKLYFPSGTYLITSKLIIPNNVIICGDYGRTIFTTNVTLDTLIDLGSSMEGIKISGANKITKGVNIVTDYCYIERCIFEYCTYGIYNNGHDVHKFIDVSTQFCTYGLYSADRLINTFIRGMVAQNNQYGIYVTYSAQQPQSLFIEQSLFYGNSLRGIYIDKDIFVLSITNCIFDGSQPRGIMLKEITSNGADITVQNCYIGGNEIPLYIGAGYAHVNIFNNRIDNGSYRGLVVSATSTVRCSHVTIEGNSLGNNGGGDMELDSPDHCYVIKNIFGAVTGTSIITNGTYSGSSKIKILENYFPSPNRITAFNRELKNNQGFKTNSEGISSIANGQTSVIVNHGLDGTPNKILVTPQGNMGSVWVDTIGATSFIVHCTATLTATTSFSWVSEII